jgi:hypothetical protein
MRERLRQTRALLLAPGAASRDASEWLARDPLRLSLVPWEDGTELAAGARMDESGALEADGGKARLVVVRTRGRALDTRQAEAFVTSVEAALAPVRAAHPAARLELTGGHAISAATARSMQRDLELTAVLSTALASIMFLVTFRRARALLAILPPLALGTLWATGLYAIFAPRLSAVATAFAAIVVGVGVDTGVHVYAALLDARRDGLKGAAAAREARRLTWKPTLAAATVAGLAFGSLALSELTAMRQLGVLCGLGEVLTAVAILGVTPELGAWLERGAPPKRREGAFRWLNALHATPRRAVLTLAIAAAPVAVVAVWGWPTGRDAIVAIRPEGLAPIATQDEIYRLFGGRPGQWVVVSADPDPERARARSDAIAEALEPLVKDGTIDGFDALAPFSPAPATVRARLAQRQQLFWSGQLRDDLAAALRDEGFDLEACAPALEAFAHPASEEQAVAPADPAAHPGLAWLFARHVAVDGGETLAVTYVRPKGSAALDARAMAVVSEADPKAVVTGFAQLERSLADSLGRELPKIGLVALGLVVLGLRAALRRPRDVALALAVLVSEIAIVGGCMRALDIRWHIYDALVLPVLVGITVDEAMFLLFAVREHGDDHLEQALDHQSPLVASTALTTAAGFAALLVCRFRGLRDLGATGAIGSAAGLACALMIVPAALRVLGKKNGSK